MNCSPCLSITLPECFRSINYCVYRNYLRLWEWHEGIIISKRSINKTARSDKIWSVEHLVDGWIRIKEWKWKWWRICQKADVILYTFMFHDLVCNIQCSHNQISFCNLFILPPNCRDPRFNGGVEIAVLWLCLCPPAPSAFVFDVHDRARHRNMMGFVYWWKWNW